MPTSGWFCPLYSFEFDADSVDLTEGIKIKRLTKGFADFLREYYRDWSVVEDKPSCPKYMVFLPSKAEYDGETEPLRGVSEKSNLLFDLITALRLCHAGEVVPGPLIYGELKDSATFKPITYFAVELFTSFISPVCRTNIGLELFTLKQYKFRESDISRVNSLIDRIGACRKAGRLRFLPDGKTKILISILDKALSRFNSAYDGSAEDRLIDQMIAFEFLYIADDKELGYKLAIRTAFFLGRRKSKIFGEMKKAYDLRGQIVHGNKKVEWTKLEETIPKTEEYLRQSLRRFLSLLTQGHSLKEIRDKLDENILKNGKILSLKE